MRNIISRLPALVRVAAAVAALLSTVQCGSTATSPTSTTGVSAVSLSATSVTAGTSGQGTVTLAAAAPTGGANITLASSNPAVATVPATVTVPAGSTTATFAITAVAPGTTTITASMNGSSSQSPALTVTARATLVSITFANGSVVGGDPAIGTVTLSSGAPAGGAVVALSGSDPVTLPPSVTVLAGATTATFSALTRAVPATVASTITGTYAGTSMSVVLSVTKPTVATASFGVSGPTETDTCSMANGGRTLACTFNGSTSTAPGPIVAWEWTYGVPSGKLFSQTTSVATLKDPDVDCSFLPSPPLPAAPADQFFKLTVTLRVRDSLGNVSAVATNPNARVFPSGVCGF